jgi:hypothetical protein
MSWITDITDRAVDQILVRMNVDTDPIFTPGFRKFIRWFGYRAIPFIFNVATFIVMVYLFNKILDKIGFEKTVVILLVLLLVSRPKK